MAVTSADVTPRLDEEPSPESTTAQRSPEPTTAQRTSPKKYARGFLQRRKGQLKLLLNAQLARVLGLTLTVGCGLGLTLLTEFYAPNFWLASDTSDLHRVHYKVEPNVDGLWSLTCDEAKSPGETCAVHLRTRSQFMRFYTYHTADDQARNNYADAPAWVADPRLSPNEIVATSSVLTQWMYYELLRGLTLGSFNGLPTLEVVFEPTERLANALASFHNASNTAGVSDALVGASAAHAMSTHVIGLHLGGVFGGESQLASMADVSLHEAGMPGTNIWRSAMPSHIYSCYASWRGGRRIDRLHNTESWGPTYCEGDGPTSSWSPLLVVYGYLGASALLAVFTSLGTLYVAQKGAKQIKYATLGVPTLASDTAALTLLPLSVCRRARVCTCSHLYVAKGPGIDHGEIHALRILPRECRARGDTKVSRRRKDLDQRDHCRAHTDCRHDRVRSRRCRRRPRQSLHAQGGFAGVDAAGPVHLLPRRARAPLCHLLLTRCQPDRRLLERLVDGHSHPAAALHLPLGFRPSAHTRRVSPRRAVLAIRHPILPPGRDSLDVYGHVPDHHDGVLARIDRLLPPGLCYQG